MYIVCKLIQVSNYKVFTMPVVARNGITHGTDVDQLCFYLLNCILSKCHMDSMSLALVGNITNVGYITNSLALQLRLCVCVAELCMRISRHTVCNDETTGDPQLRLQH